MCKTISFRSNKQYTKDVSKAITEIRENAKFSYGRISDYCINSGAFKQSVTKICKKYKLKEGNIRIILGI